ncbi:MAG: hypothetical protein XU14_C0048G0015 [Armatimonadetes bacterium CSP1-3]|nr:MAG: hypothetical protein XU14_C0048G0015 [Armatimonadetes bacterium CSP1-3]
MPNPLTAAPLTVLRAIQHGVSTARYVPHLLSAPVTGEDAVADTRERIARRADAFLEVAERAIFAHSRSAYRPLLDAAGYDLPRLRALVGRRGVEEALRQLQRDGVYVTIQEFKGLREVRRGNRVFRFSEQNFRNPLIQAGLRAASGGTRGPALWNTIPPENHRMGAEHLALALEAYGLRGAPVALWLAQAHGASAWAVLALAVIGQAPPRWFTHVGPRTPLRTRLFVRLLRQTARLRGVTLPGTTYVPLGDEAQILEWVAGAGPRGILTTPSLALRLALQAQRSGRRLDGLTFITIAEPLTAVKLRHIRAAGARAFSSLGFTEFGRATYGCAAAEGDETHICSDAVAVLQYPRRVDHLGTEVDALLFTTLRPDARRILLNVETGDYARMLPGGCGCFLERVGWTQRLRDIRSFEKLNAEGRLFYGTQLIDLVEQTLPERFGGDPTDYQLVEQEDEMGFTRLSILVHPRLDGVDERGVLATVEGALRSRQAASAEIWREAGTIRIVRATPLLTAAGKLMPLHHLA